MGILTFDTHVMLVVYHYERSAPRCVQTAAPMLVLTDLVSLRGVNRRQVFTRFKGMQVGNDLVNRIVHRGGRCHVGGDDDAGVLP